MVTLAKHRLRIAVHQTLPLQPLYLLRQSLVLFLRHLNYSLFQSLPSLLPLKLALCHCTRSPPQHLLDEAILYRIGDLLGVNYHLRRP